LKERERGKEGGRFWRSGKRAGGFGQNNHLLPPSLTIQNTGDREADRGRGEGAGDPGHGDDRDVWQNGEEVEGNLFRSSPWPGMDCGGRSTTAGGLQPGTTRAALVVVMESSGRRGDWSWRCGTRWGAGPEQNIYRNIALY
jgi:hypothetical protein